MDILIGTDFITIAFWFMRGGHVIESSMDARNLIVYIIQF